MKANVKAWQDVFNEKGLITEKKDLQALDSIMYGPVWDIGELTLEVAEKMINEFNQMHPGFQYDNIAIQTLDE